MDLREFAERVVLSTSLEEKLADPGELTDLHPGNSPPEILLPGRPDELQLQHHESTPKVSGISQLNDERERGILLHFLANHELLATELMALVLLKFPNAPAEFRQGILETLKEEQAHTKLYLQRMQECGVQFGEIPLSGYFWRMVAPMESPLDFVSRLSLTFEQANLDFSKYYAEKFRAAGDRSTAAILDAIYQDEIGHVGHGLKWFRKWKNQGDTDWDAFRKVLHFPLSPIRAKGNTGMFNREGRTEAGLDAQFIEQLDRFRHSRGRMPDVYWFNPDAEDELNASKTDTQLGRPHAAKQIAADLEPLVLFLARHEDVALMRQAPSPEFEARLIAAGFSLPEILDWPHAQHPLRERKLSMLRPWAWTPNSVQEAKLLQSENDVTWNSAAAMRYRKSWAMDWMRTALDEMPDWFAGPETLGQVVRSYDEVRAALSQLQQQGWSTALVKPDLGTSGRGQRRLPCTQSLHAADKEFVHTLLELAGELIIEPELDRQLDLSLQWERSSNNEWRFLGWTRQLITPGRRFAGTVIGQPFADCDPDMKRFLLAHRHQRLHDLVEWLTPRLQIAFQASPCHTAIGIDAMVTKDADDRLKIKPVVEVNPRMTMGRVALALEKRIAPGVRAEFLLYTRRQIQKMGFESFSTFAADKQANHALVHDRNGLLTAGFLALAEPAQCERLFPVLAVNLGRS